MKLTKTENKVMELIRQGKTSAEIAAILGCAKGTIDAHRLNIRRKLNIVEPKKDLAEYAK